VNECRPLVVGPKDVKRAEAAAQKETDALALAVAELALVSEAEPNTRPPFSST